MPATALEILKTVYGYDAFRGPQARIVDHVIAGSLAQCRINSKYLALQIKAIEAGLLPRQQPSAGG
jgi:superfamily II DNA helicase RecQ